MRSLAAAAAAVLFAACGPAPLPDPLEGCTRGLCSNGPLFAIATLTPAVLRKPGVAEGFDLDASDGPTALDCQADDYVDPEGRSGIDNQLAVLVPALSKSIGDAFPLLIQASIDEGGLLLLPEIVRLEDPSRVHVVFHRATGVPLLGTDGLLLDGQTYRLADEDFAGVCRDVRASGRLLEGGPCDVRLQLVVFGKAYQVLLREARFRLQLAEDGASASILLGGAIPVADLAPVAKTIAEDDSKAAAAVQVLVPTFADVVGGDTGKCDRISGAFNGGARTAFAMP